MASDADEVKAALQTVMDAARSGDWEVVWRSYSQAAQGVCRAAASASGATGLDGGAVLEYLVKLEGEPIPHDLEIGEVSVDGHRATVSATSRSRDETATLPFLIEDGTWKMSAGAGPAP